jgi:hypothetical protein
MADVPNPAQGMLDQLAAMKRDAARYRWLRDKSIGHRDPAPTSTMLDGYGIKVAYQMHHVDPRVAPTGFLSGDYLDALLDKLIAESAAREAARGVRPPQKNLMEGCNR